MSRWLKSVNNLLDNLDGQAENVADNVADNLGGIDNTLGQLLEKGQQAVAGFGDSSFQTDDSEEELYSSDDAGEATTDDDDGFSGEEEEVSFHNDDAQVVSTNVPPAAANINGDAPESSPAISEYKTTIQNDSKHSMTKNSAHFSIGVQQRRSSFAMESVISEISFTERSEFTEEIINDENSTAPATEATPSAVTDKTPNPPNRLDSFSVPLNASRDGSTHLENRDVVFSQLATPKVQNSNIDQSPRPPRRSLDQNALRNSVGEILLDMSTSDKDSLGATGDSKQSREFADPPKLPTRQVSLEKAGSLEDVRVANEQPTSTPQPVSAPVSNRSIKNAQKTAKSTDKESQKLRTIIQSLQETLNRTTNELKTSQVETNKLEKQVKSLDTQLQAANTEIHAQSEELRRAGERMEKERKAGHDEREELLDEQDEEIEQLKAQHTAESNDMKSNYEKQISDLTNQLQSENNLRVQEGGDWTKELEDALGRERDALKKLNEMKMEKVDFESAVSKLETQQEALQSKLMSALESVETASEREKVVQDKLDASLVQHTRQMTQRQAREADLEKTIFEMGAALTAERQMQQTPSIQPQKHIEDEENYKEKYEGMMDEVESLKTQLNFETQRREALHQELGDISTERSQEISAAQSRQQQYDRKVTDLESMIGKLKSTLRELSTGNTAVTANSDGKKSALSELDESKKEVAKLSDQLLRNQRQVETSKTEILALKGRLQSATSRADEAEKCLQTAQASPGYSSGRGFGDVESGAYARQSARRRVKGSARLRNGTASNQIRSLLNVSPGRNGSYALEQAVVTIDALDKWMVDTGSFLRHEPLARLGFLLYLVTLHLWSFALVVFHTVEEPHADFGTMDNNPRHWRAHP